MTEEGVLTGVATRQRTRESAATQLGERAARYRKERGIKVTELARAIGVSPSLISQIERGQSQPSVSTLFGLAAALGVPVDAFMESDAQSAPVPGPAVADAGEQPAPDAGKPANRADRYMVRRDGRARLDIEGGVRWERLTPQTLPHVEFLELVYAPGAQSHPELYRHPGTEMVLVLSGRLNITVGFELYELEPGDSMHFPSSQPHRYSNPGDQETHAVTVILPDADGAGLDDQLRRP
jgi:transcriptional regulator with XRE-family HTH domain